MSVRLSKRKVYTDIIDRKKWDKVLIEDVPIKYREIYLNRKKAVDMYIDNIEVARITEETGYSRNHIRYLFIRCLKVNDDGILYGYRALIPYKRIESLKKLDEETQPLAGMFKNLLNKYPELEEFIINNFFILYKNNNLNKCMGVSKLYRRFIRKCHQLKIKENEYPFDTKDMGLRSLYRYCDYLINSKYTKTK